MIFGKRRASVLSVGSCIRCVSFFCILIAPTSVLSGATSDAKALPPRTAHEATLGEGETHVYLPQLTSGRRWAVRLDQLGVDTVLEASWPEAAESLRVDSPLDRDGVELLLLPPRAVQGVELTVHGVATAGIPGKYRIQLIAVDLIPEDGTNDGSQLMPVIEAMTKAGQAYAAGGGEGRRQALAHYRRSVDLWRRLKRPRFAAQSLYAVAVLHRLLGEEAEGLATAREVLPLWQALGDLGREADTLNEIGLMESSKGRVAEAREVFHAALAVQEQVGDLFRQSATSNNLCLTHLFEGEYRQAIACYPAALERIRAAGDDENEAVALTNLGSAYRYLGMADEAFDHLNRAAAIHGAAGREKRQAETLSHLAVLHRQVDEPQEALGLYFEALTIFRRQGSRRWEGRVLHNLARTYQILGDSDRARVFYRQALNLRQQIGDSIGEASTLRRLGTIELNSGRWPDAGELFRRALKLARTQGNRRSEAMSQALIGKSYAADGQHGTALSFFHLALGANRLSGERSEEAITLEAQGTSLFALRRFPEARESLQEAIGLFRSLGMDLGVSKALHRLAEIEHAAGNPELALTRVIASIDLFESQRVRVGDVDLRATLSGLRSGAYELRIELLMVLLEAQPSEMQQEAQYLRAAFEASEQTRARGLVELLRRSDIAALEADPKQGQRLRSARRRLHLEARQQRELFAKDPPQEVLDKAESDLIYALSEFEQVKAEVRRERAKSDPGMQLAALSTEAVQGLLEPGTALLEYALGTQRSFLFVVTPTELRSYELPSRDVLEMAARRVHESLGSPHGDQDESIQLAEWLLVPALEGLAAEEHEVERLVVVPDGALNYLPFAALPIKDPAGTSRVAPLLTRYEVVHLPSASVLAAERRRSEGRPPAALWAVVLADPVFESSDPRLAAFEGSSEPERIQDEYSQIVRGGPQVLDLQRLRQSRREATVVASLAPPEEVHLSLGFDAERSLVLEGQLASYRIVHFATHGIIHADYPALSGLALSQFDASGKRQDGFLRLHDIYGLRLHADLVVLSACRTALGKEVRGEGLLGLTRGFLYAGARRVTASLWSVPDGATAELMERFYRAMVEGDLTPAAALRQAQLSMLRQRRWRDPHNWAGFVLIGDWRGKILDPLEVR